MMDKAINNLPQDASEELGLLLKAQAGDSESIERLIVNYKSLVRRIARAGFFLASGGDGEDLIQESTIGLLKAIREFKAGKSKASFAAFASVCIRNKINDALRAYSREKHKALNTASSLAVGENEEEFLPEATDLLSPDPVASYIDEEETEGFYRKVDSVLTPRQAKALRLYLEGYSYKEIASALKISSKAVDNALRTAKEKIKKSGILFKEDNK